MDVILKILSSILLICFLIQVIFAINFISSTYNDTNNNSSSSAETIHKKHKEITEPYLQIQQNKIKENQMLFQNESFQHKTIRACHIRLQKKRATSFFAQNQIIQQKAIDRGILPYAKKYNYTNNITQTVSLCVFVKDTIPYIDEFVDYNIAIGFTAIYIYDNTDHFELEEWGNLFKNVQRNIQVVHFPKAGGQNQAYQSCHHDLAINDTWVGFLDIDEFLYLRKHRNVLEFVTEHCIHGACGLYWRYFGNSNETIYRPFPVLKRFHHYITFEGIWKFIVRVQDLNEVIHMHSMNLTTDHFTTIPRQVATVNHIWSRSNEEFYIKGCLMGEGGKVRMKSRNCGKTPFVGDYFDNSTWELLLNRVPFYNLYNEI